MCLHSTIRKNPTHSFNYGISKHFVSTPCGTCSECRQEEKNEWFLRNYAQWKDTTSKGGSVFFLTLTYADVPTFKCTYNGYDDKMQSITQHIIDTPCFSYDHIVSFINLLRKLLKKHISPDIKLKWQFFPEYGSHTQRPHYHCLFYTSCYVDSRKFFHLVDGYDNDYLRHRFFKFPYGVPYFKKQGVKNGLHIRGAWHHGWVLVSKPSKGGMCVNNEKSILYCAKYATKDMSFYGKNDIKHFLSSVKDKNIPQPFDKRIILTQFERSSARHRQSTLLGFNWLYNAFISNYTKHIKEGFTISLGSDSTKTLHYPMPPYYLRKVLYHYYAFDSEDGKKVIKWFLRPNQEDIHIKIINNRIDKYCASLKYNLSSAILDKYINELSVIPCPEGFDNIRSYIDCLYKKYTPLQIAVYKYIYHNRNASYHSKYGVSYPELIKQNIMFFMCDYQEVYLSMLESYDLDLDFGYEFFKEPSSILVNDELYNNLPCFAGLSEFLGILSKLDSLVRAKERNNLDFLDAFYDKYADPCNHDVSDFIESIYI